MKIGDLVKTRHAANAGYFAYSGPATFNVKVATYPATGVLLGTIAAFETTGTVFGIGGTNWVKIKLDQPVLFNSITYPYVFIKETGVYVPTTTMAEYYVNDRAKMVNYRSGPSTVTGKVLGQLATGQLAGTSDGTKSNGFLRVTRPNNAVVWISALYVTAKAATTTTPTAGTPAPTGTDEKPTIPQVVEIKLENLVGEKAAPVIKWGLVALGVGIVVLIVVRFTKAKGGKRRK
jgi:hypothetical protein